MSPLVLRAPFAGFVLPLAEVPDPVFAEGLAGAGVAIDPTTEVLHAPCAGEVVLMPAGRHALTVRSAGVEVLLHVGIDTVRLNGHGFELLVKHGATVAAGDPLMCFSLDRIAREARSAVTPVLIAAPGNARLARQANAGPVATGDFLLEVHLPDEASVVAVNGAELRRVLTVPFEHGLHARPAARIVAALKALQAEVSFAAHGRHADARSTVALMSLGLRAGESVEVSVRGVDGPAALAALERLLPPRVAAAASRAVPSGRREGPRTVRGVVAVGGLAVGRAVPLAEADTPVPETGAGVEREERALAAAVSGVSQHLECRLATARGAQRDILGAHRELLADPELARRAARLVAQGKSAAFSFRDAARSMAAMLAELEDPLLRERAADLRDLERQVLQVLAGGTPERAHVLPQGAIVLADELLPSQLSALDPARLAGIVSARGGPTSHVAIIAAALAIPMLVAAGDEVLAIAPGTPLVLDADRGLLQIEPTAAERDAAAARIATHVARIAAEGARAGEPAITQDGVRIPVYCNAGSAADAAAAIRGGAEGCGLLRTEFLFLERSEPPDEREQVQAYRAVAGALEGRPLTIRTLDVGGDKPLAYLPLPREDNPALGLRGLRASLAFPELMAVQLRAILRAADEGAAGRWRILLPMVSEPGELLHVRRMLEEARAAVGPGPLPPLGVMIETPAAALLADQLLEQAQFVSIGTNDLSQYTLAMDRTHPELVRRLDALHPAVLRLIERAADAAHARGRESAVCGGLASDPLAVPLLLGLGIRELSAVPAVIPRLKALVRSVAIDECTALAHRALAAASAAEVRRLAAQFHDARGLVTESA